MEDAIKIYLIQLIKKINLNYQNINKLSTIYTREKSNRLQIPLLLIIYSLPGVDVML